MKHLLQKLSGSELPAALQDLNEAPEALFLRGRLLPGPMVALVGTRRPSPQGAAFAHAFAAELARASVGVASGGADGIDAAAHLGALENRGYTLVVAPCSFDCPYPETNRDLFEQVVQHGGGYLSEFEQQTVARRHLFFRRNSLLVALSHAVVVIEAPLRSGARNAALWARRLGRPLYVVPHAPWNSRGRGNIAELQLGAQLVGSPAEVLRALEARNLHPVLEAPRLRTRSAQPRVKAPSETPLPPQNAEQLTLLTNPVSAGAILRVLQNACAPLHVDELCRQTGLSAAELQSAIAQLCLTGGVQLYPGGRVGLP